MIVNARKSESDLISNLQSLLQIGGEVGRIAEEMQKSLQEISADLSHRMEGGVRARHAVDKLLDALQQRRYELAGSMAQDAARYLAVFPFPEL